MKFNIQSVLLLLLFVFVSHQSIAQRSLHEKDNTNFSDNSLIPFQDWVEGTPEWRKTTYSELIEKIGAKINPVLRTENGLFPTVDSSALLNTLDLTIGEKKHGNEFNFGNDFPNKINVEGNLSLKHIVNGKPLQGYRVSFDQNNGGVEIAGTGRGYSNNPWHMGMFFKYRVNEYKAAKMKSNLNHDRTGLMTFSVSIFKENPDSSFIWPPMLSNEVMANSLFDSLMLYDFRKSEYGSTASAFSITPHLAKFYDNVHIEENLRIDGNATFGNIQLPELSYEPSSSSDIQAEAINAPFGSKWFRVDAGTTHEYIKTTDVNGNTALQRISYAEF